MGPNNKGNISGKKSTSILAKVGNAALGAGSFLGKGIIYPLRPKNWFKSWGEIWHDIKNGGRYVIGNPLKEYDPPIKTTQASENLGVKITEQGKGKVTFLASRTLTGDIPYLTPEQLDQIKQGLPNVTIFKEENKIVIEIDVKEINNSIKNAPKNKGKSPEEIKQLVIEAIHGEVDRNFKSLAKITGGEFKIHTDRKLLHGIAEKLYQGYTEQSSEAAKSIEKSLESNEFITQNNMTDPLGMYHVKAGKTNFKGMELEDKLREAIGNESNLRFEGDVANSKTESPSPTPALKPGREKGSRAP